MSESLRIAVADDESDMRDYLEKMLPRMGFQVVAVAENGRDLVELCQSTRPDLIISDLRMPELDGDEAVCQLGGNPTIPFIAISAFSKPDDFGKRLTQGRWIYLHKPFRSNDLEVAIRRLFPQLSSHLVESETNAPSRATSTGEAEARSTAGDGDALPGARRAKSSSRFSIATRPLDLLVVDDETEFLDTVVRYFQSLGHRVVGCGDGESAVEIAAANAFDVAIVDMKMPRLSGMDLLRRLKSLERDCAVIMLTGQGTIESAVEAMKEGAFDFLTKPVRLNELEAIVQRAKEAANLRKENQQLRVALGQIKRPGKIIGSSDSMQEVFRLIQRTGPTDKPVLIQGESGTGKELVALALHESSHLQDKPLVVINCAALPETLLESELFGHEKGAFTGAIGTKPGLFEVADGGTLFIDEIGELAGSLQAKLLRVLEDGSLRRIGSVKERRVHVRLIAATNRDMLEEVQAGRFREDLFYRINVLTIQLPPLREREGDLPQLISHFAGDEWQVAPEVIATLSRYSWPGNVRQLSNAIERAKILADDEVIRLENFPPEILRFTREHTSTPPANRDDLESLTRCHVVETYERCQHNKARTARVLGIGRRSLYRLLEKYGIHEVHENHDPGKE